jgi:thioredoxin 1
MTVILNQDNFAETIKEWLTLVDFWAEWCGPCKIMLPILDEFAKKSEGSVKVWKLNVDDEQMLAAQFRIMSIPTLILFKDGAPVEIMVWVQDLTRLDEVVGKYL